MVGWVGIEESFRNFKHCGSEIQYYVYDRTSPSLLSGVFMTKKANNALLEIWYWYLYLSESHIHQSLVNDQWCVLAEDSPEDWCPPSLQFRASDKFVQFKFTLGSAPYVNWWYTKFCWCSTGTQHFLDSICSCKHTVDINIMCSEQHTVGYSFRVQKLQQQG